MDGLTIDPDRFRSLREGARTNPTLRRQLLELIDRALPAWRDAEARSMYLDALGLNGPTWELQTRQNAEPSRN